MAEKKKSTASRQKRSTSSKTARLTTRLAGMATTELQFIRQLERVKSNEIVFQVNPVFVVNPKANRMLVELSLRMWSRNPEEAGDDEEVGLCQLTQAFMFEVEGLRESGNKLPEGYMHMIVDECYGTLRGVLFVHSGQTAIRGVTLPLVDVTSFMGDESTWTVQIVSEDATIPE